MLGVSVLSAFEHFNKENLRGKTVLICFDHMAYIKTMLVVMEDCFSSTKKGTFDAS